jgi:hypothetical protein
MSQSKKILNENLNLIKLFMNYDSSKTLAENKGRKRILKEDTFDTPQEITIKNFYDKCGEHSGNGLISKSDIETIAATFNKAFAYQTWGFMGGTDDSESTGWRSVLSQMTKGNYADACRIADSYVEFTNYSGGFQKALIDELDDEELAEFYITLLKMKNNTSETKKEESSDKSVGTGGTPKTETEVYKKGTKYVDDNFSGCLNSFPEVQPDKDGIPQYKFGDNWVWYSSNLNKLVLSDSKWAYIRDVKDCNDELFKTEEKKDKVDTGSKPEQQTKTKPETKPETKQKTTQQKPKVTFIECSNTYSYGCKSEKIEDAQKCLKDQGLYSYTVDGKFGSRTLKAIKSKLNKTYFNDSDITTICGKKQEEKPLDSGSTPGGGSKKEEEYVWNGTEI